MKRKIKCKCGTFKHLMRKTGTLSGFSFVFTKIKKKNTTVSFRLHFTVN